MASHFRNKYLNRLCCPLLAQKRLGATVRVCGRRSTVLECEAQYMWKVKRNMRTRTSLRVERFVFGVSVYGEGCLHVGGIKRWEKWVGV
jgi:hypothetical protein